MSVLPVGFGSSSGIDTGDIPASLRFRSSASAYLSKTITTDATSTYFAAVKRGKLGVISPIFDTNIKFNANDTLTAFGLTTTAVFRDPTSWLFIHVSNGGLYINGVSYGAVTTSALTNPRIGFDGTNYFDGYIARIGCVAGSSSAYTNFGELNTTINEWVSHSSSSVKAVVDAGGTNSFMLDFDDATSLTTLGYDKSTKGNNWTLNNFSLTAGTTYDHMLDVPGNSYATWNPLNSNAAPTSGNLVFSSGNCDALSTFALPETGKWYFENFQAVSDGLLGFIKEGTALSTGTTFVSHAGAGKYLLEHANSTSSQLLYWNSTGTSVLTNKNTLTTGTSVICMAYDAATRKVWAGYSVAGSGAITWWNSGDPVAGTGEIGTLGTGTFYVMGACVQSVYYPNINFGQGALSASASFKSDAAGYFALTPPTGFLALCQANLPDIDPTTLLNPEDHHVDIPVLKSGDTPFTLPWNADTYDTFFEIKRRDAAGDWYQIDGLRGYTKILKSNSTAAETTDANVLGISGTTGTLKSTLADGTYIVSATKAGLSASRQTNTDGSITSTVSRNVDSGFAIVLHTNTGVAATIGHGLGKAFKLGINRVRQRTENWRVYFGAANQLLILNSTSAAATDASIWNNTQPTSSVFSVGTYFTNGDSIVTYCYADSAIQKSFSYTGNNSLDGPNPFLGFKCGRALIKAANSAFPWQVYDSARNTCNVCNAELEPNNSNAENGSTYPGLVDFTANSLKIRDDDAGSYINKSTYPYIGHAWAAVTGKYSLSR